ncbi:MAG: phosphorylase [Anaerolineales bacterium]|nr:phosphorylase [Anaerolineales bacterium]
MSIPSKAREYGDKVVIEPVRVIEERKQIGLHPSCPVPAGAILCYDSAFWQWVKAGPGNVEGDGWLKGAYLVPYQDSRILVLKVPGFGAPTAVMTLEELAAYGIKKFVNLGTAGGLQQNMNIGDIVVCDRAIRDEGTSFHYLPDDVYADSCPELTENLCVVFESKGIQYRKGSSWTTDAPYRETIGELRQYRADGVATVEMEASALFAVGAYRGVCVSAVFAISDLLSEEDWKQEYHSAEKLEGLKQIFEVALEAIAEQTEKGK